MSDTIREALELLCLDSLEVPLDLVREHPEGGIISATFGCLADGIDALVAERDEAKAKVAWNAEHIREVVVLERERREAAEAERDKYRDALREIAERAEAQPLLSGTLRLYGISELARAALRDDTAAVPSSDPPRLVPFVGEATLTSDTWPAFETNFYRAPNGQWVYAFADEHIVAAVPSGDAEGEG